MASELLVGNLPTFDPLYRLKMVFERCFSRIDYSSEVFYFRAT